MLRMGLVRTGYWLLVFVVLGLTTSWAQGPAVIAKAETQPAPESRSTSSPDVNTASKPAADPANFDPAVYRIGVEDELGIAVWHEPDLSTGVVVRPDGMITLPLLNDLKVIGMTTKELQDALTDRFKEFVKEPQVTVIVRQIKSRKVYLLGEVARPGTYPLNNPKTVLQLLAEAGGPGPFAKMGSMYVIRQQNGTKTIVHFHYKRAMSGKSLSDDVTLQPGDMVVVP